jgi:hypothetical protein
MAGGLGCCGAYGLKTPATDTESANLHANVKERQPK